MKMFKLCVDPVSLCDASQLISDVDRIVEEEKE